MLLLASTLYEPLQFCHQSFVRHSKLLAKRLHTSAYAYMPASYHFHGVSSNVHAEKKMEKREDQ